jgi:predicted dehydrogenase
MAQGAIDRHPDARFFSDYREMFASVADQIDVVTVSTPDHMHFPIAMEAIRLGKPLMVQKPLTNNLWEARMLSKFAEEKGVLNVMGNQGATFAGTRVLREWIDAGLIGDPFTDQLERLRRGGQATVLQMLIEQKA